ncbi:tRNA (guanosine(37)-N1)-methyltransferase TrmD [Spirillospora sp. NPDC047279]|uniref:tRNA (guanosine(37)-N1)-methyltransferase TrmD n=1 Tax=Spirillospora sp. NPDC047279 TaxID=3155478 RepID=UPI0033EA4DFE
MKLDIITIFPDYFAPLDVSLLGKARRNGLIEMNVHDLRLWTHDRHRTVDDTPYGGGPGMVMKPEPWGEALDALTPPAGPPSTGGDQAGGGGLGGVVPRLVVPTPSGRPFTQALAVEYAAEPWLIFACGRYEGIDSRVVEEARVRMRVDEVSLGDFVLAGGEVAVLVMVEAISRLVPGVLGNFDSVTDDSFAPGAMESLLEGPVYTKPPVWRDRAVPDVLLSGNHGAIARWRRDQALRRTVANRPELAARLDPGDLDKHDRQVLADAGFPVDGEHMAH